MVLMLISWGLRVERDMGRTFVSCILAWRLSVWEKGGVWLCVLVVEMLMQSR